MSVFISYTHKCNYTRQRQQSRLTWKDNFLEPLSKPMNALYFNFGDSLHTGWCVYITHGAVFNRSKRFKQFKRFCCASYLQGAYRCCYSLLYNGQADSWKLKDSRHPYGYMVGKLTWQVATRSLFFVNLRWMLPRRFAWPPDLESAVASTEY